MNTTTGTLAPIAAIFAAILSLVTMASIVEILTGWSDLIAGPTASVGQVVAMAVAAFALAAVAVIADR